MGRLAGSKHLKQQRRGGKGRVEWSGGGRGQQMYERRERKGRVKVSTTRAFVGGGIFVLLEESVGFVSNSLRVVWM